MACKNFTPVALALAFLFNFTPLIDAARVDIKSHSPVSERSESLIALHSWSNYTGKEIDDAPAHHDCDLSRYHLGDRFKDFVTAGSGANGCVVLAKDTRSGGTMVAIKVSKRPGKLHDWQRECNGMKKLRQAACKSEEQMALAEMYLPTCLEVGGTDAAPYIIMHAAPPNGIGGATHALHGDVAAHIFAQLVGAVTALHGVGFTHNDLHNQNVVVKVEHDGSAELSLLDFGEIVPLARGGLHGNWKQDEYVFGRNAFRLAKCPEAAFFPDVGKGDQATPSQHSKRKAALLACLTKEWGVDDQFKDAFVAVMDEAFARKVPSLVPSLYHTSWVQEHQGDLIRKYPTPDGWCDESALVDEPEAAKPEHHHHSKPEGEKKHHHHSKSKPADGGAAGV